MSSFGKPLQKSPGTARRAGGNVVGKMLHVHPYLAPFNAAIPDSRLLIDVGHVANHRGKDQW